MTRMRGQGGPLVKREKGSIIPSRSEIVKDLIKWFATEYGLDLAEKLFEPIDMSKLTELWKQRKQKQLAAKSGGGAVLIVLALLAFGGKRGRKR